MRLSTRLSQHAWCLTALFTRLALSALFPRLSTPLSTPPYLHDHRGRGVCVRELYSFPGSGDVGELHLVVTNSDVRAREVGRLQAHDRGARGGGGGAA